MVWSDWLWMVLKMLGLMVCLLLGVAYLMLAERKIVGFMQIRLGPNRLGYRGLLQPIADVLKLLIKEIMIPARANRYLYLLAPVVALAPTFAAWAVVPFGPDRAFSQLNIGILYVLAMTSTSIYGILIAGWASNSKYAFLGALRSAAQMVSYELAMGFAIMGVLLLANTMNLQGIVEAQAGHIGHWYVFPLLPLFGVYWIAAIAETNRLPFDVAEGESEIVAGFHVEYAGMTFALFFVSEYINMMLLACIASLLFLGGWLSPFAGLSLPGLAWLAQPSLIWLLLKIVCLLFSYLWIRATFPRYRYDQIMYLGWKVLIPITLVWITGEAVVVRLVS